MINNISAH